jgi:Zn-finger nucleic acid-binding protein
MNCPKCETVMREREKGEIIIDICPNCRGVFLDAGELEKLVAAEERVFERRGWQYDDDDDDDDDRRRYRDDRGSRDDRGYREDSRGRVQTYDTRSQPYPPKKKKSFLSSMFESFGEGGAGDD